MRPEVVVRTPRGRRSRRGVVLGVGPSVRRHLLALLAPALAACGGLESPDLTSGSVAGRLVGARTGAYAYVLGRPDQPAPVAGDAFTLDAVPAGAQEVVVLDGADAYGVRRAERIAVEIRGAERVELPELYGDMAAVGEELKMPLAARVHALATCEGGTPPEGRARFSVAGTDQLDRVAGANAVAVLEVPQGDAVVSAAMAGFVAVEDAISVGGGATTVMQLGLLVDASASAAGCKAWDNACRNGLSCAPDGFCHACVVNAHCGTGGVCDLKLHLCRAAVSTTAGSSDACRACTPGASTCAYGSTCVPSGGSGYCSRSCVDSSSCPAGFTCEQVANLSSKACVPVGGCSAVFAAFGQHCFDATACGALGAGARCRGAYVSASGTPVPGYCSATCDSDGDCVAPGFQDCSSEVYACSKTF